VRAFLLLRLARSENDWGVLMRATVWAPVLRGEMRGRWLWGQCLLRARLATGRGWRSRARRGVCLLGAVVCSPGCVSSTRIGFGFVVCFPATLDIATLCCCAPGAWLFVVFCCLDFLVPCLARVFPGVLRVRLPFSHSADLVGVEWLVFGFRCWRLFWIAVCWDGPLVHRAGCRLLWFRG